jgi:hypothetical protein
VELVEDGLRLELLVDRVVVAVSVAVGALVRLVKVALVEALEEMLETIHMLVGQEVDIVPWAGIIQLLVDTDIP